MGLVTLGGKAIDFQCPKSVVANQIAEIVHYIIMFYTGQVVVCHPGYKNESSAVRNQLGCFVKSCSHLHWKAADLKNWEALFI